MISEPAAQDSMKESTHTAKSGTSSNRRLSLSAVGRSASGLLGSVRGSFHSAKKQTGSSVETLRGSSGSDFEGYANVHRGDGNDMFSISSLFSCFGKKDAPLFLLIKGVHCFVFKDEEGKSPKYAIELMPLKAVLQPSHESFIPRVPHPGAGHDTTYTTIHLETSLGDIEYKLTFANMDSGLASHFCNAVAVASNAASTEQVKKRLGHQGLLHKRGSVRYAEKIGGEKAKDQPDAPMGAGEVLAGMPAPVVY